jgi:hypothetical protein
MDGYRVYRRVPHLRIKVCTNSSRTSSPVRPSFCGLLSAAEFFPATTCVATIWVLAPALRCICECGRVFALPLNCTATSNTQSFLWQKYMRSDPYFCSAYLHGIFLTFLLSPNQRLREDVRVYCFRDMLYYNVHILHLRSKSLCAPTHWLPAHLSPYICGEATST